ncbi:SHOCT domain-containing protein [Streptomyces sp. APSN-46.1]|uniref:SHOCT domain-containing protein n=1 Tax=Streptomyces sp. APSN-46.1 TaxID=2929049 RepID=UPI001FB50063|nr:SHOCT domain-containing protein [Streptomyces sp. APSN-46.1]MCJ1676512.1 SHOCT domain-containing protein [Streptomyces sp. APSN-46.1]
MNALAYDGPGPWILFLPLIWAAVVIGAVTLLRRTVWRGRLVDGRAARGPRRAGPTESTLGRRFASGEIGEDEYWRRLSVLDEQFGRTLPEGKGGVG